MDLSFSPQQAELAKVARTHAREVLAGTAAEREARHAIPHEVMRGLAERGLLGVNLPKELGGAQAGVVAYAAALREIAWADAAVAVTMAVTNMVGEVIARFGTAEQKRRHVPRLASGEYFGGAFALSEPGAGSDAGSLTTRAEQDGAGWVLNGQKLWISTGDQAGVLVVWARTGGEGPKGISCFLVEGGAAGLSAHEPEDKMGLRASHTVGLTLQDVRVGPDALLGELGGGFRIAMAALDGGRIGIGAQALGLGTRALELVRAALPKEPEQGAQFAVADMATELDAAWLLTLRAAALKERGEPFSLEAAMAKVMASETANRVTRGAVQLLGLRGYMEEAGVARLVRDCRVTQIYEGTSEVQRVVISRSILKG